MLNDFHNLMIKLDPSRRDEETSSSAALMNNSTANSEIESSSSQTDTTLNYSTGSLSNNNSSSSLSTNSGGYVNSNSAQERNTQQHHHQYHHQQQQQSTQLGPANVQQLLQQHQQQQSIHGSYNSGIIVDSGYNNLIKQENCSSIPVSSNGAGGCHNSDNKSFAQSLTKPVNMNVEASQLISLAPIAHGSDHQHNMHYSLTSSKTLTNSSPSSLALNFSHDLLQSGGHQSNHQSPMHHHSSDVNVTGDNNGGGGGGGGGNKHQNSTGNAFELDSGSLMQSAAAGMWKNTMNLTHFKHSTMADHSFLPTSDMNTTFSWAHNTNMGHHQTAQQMTHHILDGQHHHLIGYPQHHHHHQRASLPIPNQSDLVGNSLKSQSCAAEQATTFMLNSINHQASTSNNPHIPITSHHHTTQQPHEILNIRSQPLESHSAAGGVGGGGSYNLADSQFYGSSRSENRSHSSSMKPTVLMTDKPMQLSLSNHQANQLHHYHHATTNHNDHSSPQPTTSQHAPGASSGQSSRNIGNFRCQHCDQVFNMRNLYQSHLKTHSRERGAKAKFHCELCGHSFSQKTSLNRHMKSHTGERPFPCEVCGKAFSEKERLKIHMRTHTGEKPFSCGICGKSFSQKSTVKRHQTVHTGEKKFKCDCGKGFANRGNLIAHIKTRGSNHFE